MKSWNELSMAEKANVMKLAVEGGVYDLDSIRSGYNEYAKGGKIHIDPSKKGTFTAAASKHGMGVQEFASKVLAHKENYSPAMVKKANFARNSRRWKHGLGGNLFLTGGPTDPPKYSKANEAYYDPDTDTVYAPDSTGEFYHHEMFHARPDSTFLEAIKPYYEGLNDEKLSQMGADLSFVKRIDNDPNHFYSPEEIGARVKASSFMLKNAGVKDIDKAFLGAARKNEGKYGDNFRDLLHMYSNENLLNIFNLFGYNKKKALGGNLYAHGGELGNYYDGWGDTWNSLKKGYYDTKAKARKAIKDLGLDRGPIEHIVSRAITASKDIRDNRNSELSIPVSLALNAGRIVGINKAIKASDSDTQYRQNLYNLIDPTNAIPEYFYQVANHAKAVRKAKSGNNYSYRRKHEDKAADAAWAKRLGLPYDSTILINNPDGSVHLAEYLENEIPTDTTFIKTRIADNEKLRDKTYGPDRGKIEDALTIDRAALESLRHTYETGEPVEMNEFSHVNRHLFNNGETTPLNLLHRYTIQYNKGNNTMDYRDIYDFDGFEDYIPGKPFSIQGSINLNKRK